MNSCLYKATVMHHRLAPKQHRFHYQVYLFYLDLDEIDMLSGKLRWMSRNPRLVRDDSPYLAGIFAATNASTNRCASSGGRFICLSAKRPMSFGHGARSR